MKALSWIFLALFLAAGGSAAAQEDEANPIPVAGQQGDDAYHPAAEPAAGPMSLDDARTNFGTVIDAFISQRSPNGYWPLKDKATGQIKRLKLLAKDPKSLREEGGGGHYAGLVTLQDAETRERITAEFLVDFTGTEWKVERMKLVPRPKPKKKETAIKRAPGKPAESAPAPPAGQPN
ncbi:MAG: hypothetical protein HY077_00860 [Elusimicrobia bacterium]|nr:hypothetical protein [Elusimicrobiota bacterium]